MDASNPESLDHFSERAEAWQALYELPQFRDRLSLFVDSVAARVRPDSKILDYGCGTGTLSAALAGSFSVTGIDGAVGMIEQSKGLHADTGAQFELIEPEKWTGLDEPVDAIVCSSVIEYVPDHERLLSCFSRSLTPGGWLFISVPNGVSVTNHARNILRTLTGKRSDSEFAQKLYYPSANKEMMTRSGFNLVDTTSFEFPMFGNLGVKASRLPVVGMMSLLCAQKT